MAKPDFSEDALSVGGGFSLFLKPEGSPVDNGRTATGGQKRECPRGWAWAPLMGLVALALALGSPVLAAESPVIRAGSELDFRPYGFTDKDGQPTGFGPELLKSVADKMGLQLQRTVGPWETVWKDLVAGNLDVLPIVARTPGREALVDFSLPHTETFDAFFVRPGQPAIVSLAAAAGKEIVVLREDAAHHQLLERKFAGKIIAVGSIPEGLRLVAAGKHDAFLCSKVIGMLELKAAKIGGVQAGPPIPDYKRTFCFGVRKGQAELVEKLNQGLLIIKSDGTYDRIYHRWLDTHEPRYPYLPWLRGAAAVAGGLAIAVLVLQGLVRRRTRELRELNAALEARVAERTAALRATNERLEKVLAVDAVGVMFWDLTTGRLVDANETFLKMMGYSRGDLEARDLTWQKFTPPEYHEVSRAEIEKFQRTGRVGPYEKEYFNKDGTRRWLLFSGSSLGGNVCVEFCVDIADRKKAEAELRESQRQNKTYADLLRLSKQPFGSGYADGRLGVVNSALEELVGYTEQELRTITWHEITPSEWLEKEKELLAELERTGTPIRYEKEYIRKDGRRVPVELFCGLARDTEGRPEQYYAFVTDLTERKRAEAALQASERYYRRLVETAQEGIWLIDAQGHTTFANAKMGELLGYTPEEMLGRHLFEFMDEEAKRQAQMYLGRRERGISEQHEFRFRRKDGSDLWSMVSTNPLMDANGNYTDSLAMVTDITERKRAEEKLRASEEQFRLLYEKAPLGIARIDSSTGRFLLLNKKYCEILQRTEAEALQLEFQTVTHPDDLESDLENMRRLREGRCRSFEMDKRYLGPDGSIVWVHLTVVAEWAKGQAATAHIAMVADITKRKQAEEAVRESEERFRQLADGASVMIWVGDPEGNNRYVNRAYREFCGVTPQQAEGQGWQPLIHPEDRARYVEAFFEAVRERKPFRAELRMRRHDGAWRWMESRANPRFSASGEFLGMTGSCPDITEQKEFEAELQRLIDERTAKLQDLVGELEHFSYTITHDLKSPLRAMRGFAEIAGTFCERSEAKECLGRISTSAERMDRLIADALNYSRTIRQDLPLEDVDAGALLRGMLDSYPEFQTARAHIVVEGTLPVVLANEAGLTQVFSNLLGNAVKFVRPGGKAEIRVWAEGEMQADHGGQTPCAVQNGWARIWVEDKGIGISREMLPRVFDMFARGSKEYDGTGIGLALVRKVVQRMGGKVGVESEEGQGSRFWVELKCGEARKNGGKATLSRPAKGNGGTVLYVEDEESDAMFMQRAFERKGLETALRVVGDGRSAIEYLSGAGEYGNREEYPRPALVLLDLNLPQVGGFEVLRWMRNNPDYAQTPVVMFSSSTREDDRVKAKELGADEFVAKPSSGLKFGEVVDGLQGKWMGRKGG